MRALENMEYHALIDTIGPTLRNITYRFSRFSGGFSAEDLYQECLLHLWEKYRCGHLAGKTDSYILQGCYFHLSNYLRVHRVKAHIVHLGLPVAGADGESPECDVPGEGTDFRAALHAKMLYETLINNGFTSREKDVLRLWRDNLDTRSIGARLGISHVRVVKLMGSIREKCLREYNE